MSTRKNLLIVVGEWWEAHHVEQQADPASASPGRAIRLVRWLLPNAAR